MMDVETQADPASTKQQDVWASADFSQLDVATTLVAELLCESLDLRPRQLVLDVGTGSGNAALAAARRGCKACGLDSLPAQLERARERARAERLRAGFQLGDPQAIPFADESFDVVLSVFGVMFTPDQPRAATELLRVCRPGGTIGLANWAADGFVGSILQVAAQRAPPIRGFPEPAIWGTEQGVRALFGDRVGRLEVSRRTFIFRCRSPESFLASFRTCYSPALSAFQMLDGPEQKALWRTLMEVVDDLNLSEDGTMIVPAD